MLIEIGLIRGLRVLVRRTETDLDDVVLQSLRWPVVITIVLVGLWGFS